MSENNVIELEALAEEFYVRHDFNFRLIKILFDAMGFIENSAGSSVKEVFIQNSDESGLLLGQAFIHALEQCPRFRSGTASVVFRPILE